jgi:hypothetical protein
MPELGTNLDKTIERYMMLPADVKNWADAVISNALDLAEAMAEAKKVTGGKVCKPAKR